MNALHPRTTGRLLLLLAGLPLLAACAASVPLRTPVAEPVVLARFLLDVEGLEADFPDQGEGAVPAFVRLVQTGQAVSEASETLRDPEASLYRATVDTVYAVFGEAMAAHFGLRLLALDTLKGRVPYLAGVPLGTSRKVMESGYPGPVMEVEAYVTVPDAVQSSWSALGSGRARVSGHPEVHLRVHLRTADGRLAWRDQVRVRSAERVELTERWLLGFRTRQDVSAPAPALSALLRQAVAELAARHPR